MINVPKHLGPHTEIERARATLYHSDLTADRGERVECPNFTHRLRQEAEFPRALTNQRLSYESSSIKRPRLEIPPLTRNA